MSTVNQAMTELADKIRFKTGLTETLSITEMTSALDLVGSSYNGYFKLSATRGDADNIVVTICDGATGEASKCSVNGSLHTVQKFTDNLSIEPNSTGMVAEYLLKYSADDEAPIIYNATASEESESDRANSVGIGRLFIGDDGSVYTVQDCYGVPFVPWFVSYDYCEQTN